MSISPAILLSGNIYEYVEALRLVHPNLHVVDNAQRVALCRSPNVHAVKPPSFDQDGFFADYILKHEIQIVYAQGRQSLMQFVRVQRKIKRPLRIVTTSHSGYVWRNALKSLCFVVLTSLYSDGMVFLAARSYRKWSWLCRILRCPAWYLPNPVDVLRFPIYEREPHLPQIVLGVVGVINPMKGQHILVQAVRKLIEQGYNVRLRVVGEVTKPIYGHHLLQIARHLEVDNHIDWLDRVPYDEIPVFLQSIDLFVCPSFCEVMPFSILEAMAAGLPVIASDIGGISDLVRNDENGWLVRSGDVKMLAQYIAKVIDDESFTRMGKASRQATEDRFSCQIIGPKMRDILLGSQPNR